MGEVTFTESASQTITIQNKGDLPMGIGAIFFQDKGDPENFSVSYDEEDITCVDRSVDVVEDAAHLVIGAGCSLPVTVTLQPVDSGVLFGALQVETITEDEASPRYFADARNDRAVAIFQGVASRGNGRISVSERLIQFGELTADEESRPVFIQNTGEGALTLEPPVAGDRCSEGISFDLSLFSAGPLSPGEWTMFEVDVATTEMVECIIEIPSDDLLEPRLEVMVRAGWGERPLNVSPRVQILSPSVGAVFSSSESIDVEIAVRDPDQDAHTLSCELIGAAALDASIASCVPRVGAETVTVTIPAGDLMSGAESLYVVVTDDAGSIATASVPVLWDAARPASDLDGDGFAAGVDCDDTDARTYPGAAERPDNVDNDCDAVIDEETVFYDNDGDGFTEAMGDCDDVMAASYPGAPETVDERDNDCDGVIDEITTSIDEDGDGVSVAEGDCNDSDPTIFPGQLEECGNDIDEDCDGFVDRVDPEGCTMLDATVRVIGGCLIKDRALNVGERTTASMFVYAPDSEPEDIRIEWAHDNGNDAAITVGDSGVATISWDIEAEIDADDGPTELLIYGIVTNGPVEDGPAQDWCSDTIHVYPADAPLVEHRETTVTE